MMKSGKRSRSRGSGFTLIELLVVIAIIAILAALLLPSLAKAKEYGKRTQCLGTLRQMALGSINYADLYNGWEMPAAYGWSSPHYAYYWTGGGLLESTFKECLGLTSISRLTGWPRNMVCPNATLAPTPNASGLINESYPFFCYGMNCQDFVWGSAFLGSRQSQVRFPSQKINFIDSVDLLTGMAGSNYASYYAITGEAYSTSVVAYRHSQGASIAFHDGHAAWTLYKGVQGNTSIW